MRWVWAASLVLIFSGCVSPETAIVAGGRVTDDEAAAAPPGPRVVVAQFDTGTNPFHPCFRRADATTPQAVGAWVPTDAKALDLTFGDTYPESLAASKEALAAIEPNVLYHVTGTNLLYYGDVAGNGSLVDTYPHGSQASSQIVCREFGMAPEAYLVVLNWYTRITAERRETLVRWAADQPWIDVIHLNIQDLPSPAPTMKDKSIEYAIQKGKFVVIAGGNGVGGGGANYPMELSRFNGPAGSLIAGANDNGGYTTFSNLNPHVVMDGSGTRAAAPRSFESTSFGGTSSASPRITGYVTHLLYQLRVHFGSSDGSNGPVLLELGPSAAKPTVGPLADGKLTVAELHEIVRKTARPNPHDSKYDGGASSTRIPQPVDSPIAVYAKMGYGEVSEHTIGDAFNVTIGAKPMPMRHEDVFYERSETFRRTWWG